MTHRCMGETTLRRSAGTPIRLKTRSETVRFTGSKSNPMGSEHNAYPPAIRVCESELNSYLDRDFTLLFARLFLRERGVVMSRILRRASASAGGVPC